MLQDTGADAKATLSSVTCVAGDREYLAGASTMSRRCEQERGRQHVTYRVRPVGVRCPAHHRIDHLVRGLRRARSEPTWVAIVVVTLLLHVMDAAQAAAMTRFQ